MPASLSFDAAWRDLNHRSATLWFLLFGCIPGMFLLAHLLNDLLLQDAPMLLVALAWMTAIAWAGSPNAQAQLLSLQPAKIGESVSVQDLSQRVSRCCSVVEVEHPTELLA